MLLITIVTLLITNNIISRIQAEEQEERKSQVNETPSPVYKSNSLIEALKVQKRDNVNIVPESYVEQTNHVDKSQRGNRLQRDLPKFDNFLKKLISHDKKLSVFDAPSDRTGPVNYIASRVKQKNIIYPESDGKNNVYGFRDVLIGNNFSDNPNVTNVYEPILLQENITYRGNPVNKTSFAININQSNNTYPKSIENNKDALKPVIHQSGNFYPSSNDSEAGTNTKNNTESQGGSVKQNTSDSQGNSSSTNYDSDSSSHIESTTLYNEEREAFANKHTKPNGQMSLSSNLFYSLSYSFIVLLKYSLF